MRLVCFENIDIEFFHIEYDCTKVNLFSLIVKIVLEGTFQVAVVAFEFSSFSHLEHIFSIIFRNIMIDFKDC